MTASGARRTSRSGSRASTAHLRAGLPRRVSARRPRVHGRAPGRGRARGRVPRQPPRPAPPASRVATTSSVSRTCWVSRCRTWSRFRCGPWCSVQCTWTAPSTRSGAFGVSWRDPGCRARPCPTFRGPTRTRSSIAPSAAPTTPATTTFRSTAWTRSWRRSCARSRGVSFRAKPSGSTQREPATGARIPGVQARRAAAP